MNDYLAFHAEKNPPKSLSPDDVMMVFRDGLILVKNRSSVYDLPTRNDLLLNTIPVQNETYTGSFKSLLYFFAEVAGDDSLPPGYEFVKLRPFQYGIDEELYCVCARALHLAHWEKTHRFCGRCGTKMQPKKDDRAKECPACGMLSFPRISPAIIVAVVNNNRLLLAKNKKSAFDFYSVLAGFVEPGESFEQCVRREVFEEVNVRVKNIRYFGSQPWPYPDTLMVGFTAEYDGGEICEDGIEIETAGWFSPNNLPKIPPATTISRKLIDWFINTYK